MSSEAYLETVEREFRRLKQLVDRGLSQVQGDDLFRHLTPEGNSIAVLMKHLSGNMRSRWRDFLNSDGEKPDRDRDSEFVLGDEDTRDGLFERWEEGWRILLQTVADLEPQDVERTVFIRGEPHSVVQALQRQLSHYAYHVGQIVLLARHLAPEHWQSLSVPKGRSREFNRRPNAYLDDGKDR